MTLFAILICFWLQHYRNISSQPAQIWLTRYGKQGRQFLSRWQLDDSIMGICLLLLPLLIIVLGIDYALKDSWAVTLDFVLHVVILFVCLDTRSLSKQLASYLNACNNHDEQAAFRYGLTFLDQASAHDFVTLARDITRYIFLQADLYLFSVIFWYIVLGPAGALVYAATRTFAELLTPSAQLPSTAAQSILAILDWIPTRLTALSYALAGHFSPAFVYLRRHFLQFTASGKLSADVGLAALERDAHDSILADGEENQDALTLVERSFVVWIVAIALCTLAAWVA